MVPHSIICRAEGLCDSGLRGFAPGRRWNPSGCIDSEVPFHSWLFQQGRLYQGKSSSTGPVEKQTLAKVRRLNE